VDFKGEAITFKATTAGILATLNHCLELVAQREEGWRRRVEREIAARRTAEERLKSAVSTKRRFAHKSGIHQSRLFLMPKVTFYILCNCAISLCYFASSGCTVKRGDSSCRDKR